MSSRILVRDYHYLKNRSLAFWARLMATVFVCLSCILYKLLVSDANSVIYFLVDMILIICCALRFSISQAQIKAFVNSVIFLTLFAGALVVMYNMTNIGLGGIADLFSFTEETYAYKNSGIFGYDLNMISAPIALCFLIFFVEKKYYAAFFIFIMLIFMLSRGTILSLILTLTIMKIFKEFRMRTVITIFFSISIGYIFYFGENFSIIQKQVTILQGINFLFSANLFELLTGDASGQYTFNSYYEYVDTSVIVGHTLIGTFALQGISGIFPVVAVLCYLFYQSYMLRVLVLFLFMYASTSIVTVHFCLPILLVTFLKSRFIPTLPASRG